MELSFVDKLTKCSAKADKSYKECRDAHKYNKELFELPDNKEDTIKSILICKRIYLTKINKCMQSK
jgi:hypothetical protein